MDEKQETGIKGECSYMRVKNNGEVLVEGRRLIEKFESLDLREERERECEMWECVAVEETLDLHRRSL